MNKAQSLIIVLTLAGCVGVPVPPEPAAEEVPQLSKDEVRNLGAADGFDFCAAYGWYDDGICDLFCQQPDGDCEQAESDDTCESACASTSPLPGCRYSDSDFAGCVSECNAIKDNPNQLAIAQACSSATQCHYFPPQACFDERGTCVDMCIAAHNGDSCFDEADCGQICSQDIYWGVNDATQLGKMQGCFDEGLCQDAGQLSKCVALAEVRQSENTRDARCADICGRSTAGCFDAQSCAFFCPEESDTEETFQAFEECVVDDETFFCYWTVDDCVANKLAQN